MARTYFVAANVSSKALVANTAQTVLQIKAPTNQRVAVQQIFVSFDGTVNTNTPVTVQIYRQTSAGTASSSTATIVKKDHDNQNTIQTGVKDTQRAAGSTTPITTLVLVFGHRRAATMGERPYVKAQLSWEGNEWSIFRMIRSAHWNAAATSDSILGLGRLSNRSSH